MRLYYYNANSGVVSFEGANISGKKVPCSAPAMANKSPKQASAVDMYWFAYAADPPAERQRRGLWAQQVDELASPEQEIEGARSPGSHKESPCSPLDTYWFAHAGGGTPSEDAVDHGASPDKPQTDGDAGDYNHQNQQVSREERIRMVKERQEEERTRRLQEFQLSAQAAQQYREQQEEERRRRIEELRQRDQERRQQVEERKRLIWEAEHERKEAVLRRSMDRDTKVEARRNANRMSTSFAFGSSTPRTFDLDLATMGASGSSILMSATNSRRPEERDFEACKKRAASSYNLCQAGEGSCEADSGSQRTAHFADSAFVSPTTGGWLVGSGVTVGDDPMTRSMIVQGNHSSSSNIRGRRKTDLMPVIPWNRGGATPSRSRSPGTSSSMPGTAKRAVSMTRLDALAQPRRRFTQSDVTSATPPSMAAKSMLNLASHPSSKRGASNSMSKSMHHLVGGEPRLRQARSMCHLAVLPRQTRSSMLRTSKMSLSPAVAQGQREHQSPSRPRSSMSMASEQSVQSSQASTVSLRPRPPQRKPRPLSIAGTIPDRSLSSSRTTFGADKSGSSSPEKASRARSVTCVPPEVPPKPAHLRKPQKPQPPASSPSRREQRTTPKPSRSQPNLASKASALSSPGGEEQDAAAVQTVAGQAKNNQPKQSVSETTLPGQSECQQKPHDSPAKSANVPQPEEPTAVKEESETKESIQATPSQVKEDSPVREGSPVKEHAESRDSTPAKEPATAAECVPVKEGTPVKERSTEPAPEEGTPSTKAPRVISEEEARALLAEKRRLAREQAEREAELERQRQEELRRQEEERLRMEEEEQRRFEEEQIRLAEAFRKQEEEKLQRAIEEQAKREAEEQQRRELEAQQKAEREEQERRAKEEAEKQRKELEERLKREEAERAERKKRVEEIMSRTRRRGGARDSPTQAQKSSSPESDALASQESNGSATNGAADEGTTLLGSNESEASSGAPSKMTSENATDTGSLSQPDENASLNFVDDTSVPKGTVEESAPVTAQEQVEDVVDSVKVIEQVEVLAPTTERGVPQESARENDLDRLNASEQIVAVVDRSVGVVASEAQKDVVKPSQGVRENSSEVYPSIEEVVPMEESPLSKPTSPAFGSDEVCHTNGYGHHGGLQDSVVNGVSSGKVADLLDLDSLSSMVPLKSEPTTNSSTAADHTVDNLINVDDINSNRVSGNPLIAFEQDNKNTKAQESPQLTDLLS
ncbi:ensconsin-like isoform X2 [Ornithodoros turicata]|uniref:ensconsin-like isoform X2 n=1 Tax=Ornithodoros turicata TaxID=34597 RepID=UPI00313A073F